MATEEKPSFGQVSRLKGVVFESLSFTASVFGIAALAVLLVYVTIDAFGLTEASPEWLLTYFLTLVVPYAVFCLYSVGSATVTRQVAVALGGGLLVTVVGFRAFELLVGPIPRLTWHLAYLFAVVIPVVCYLTYAASREPAGWAGLGLVGRLLGGAALGAAVYILFLVFDVYLWFLAYTLGFLPAVATYVYGSRRPASAVSLATVPVGVVGVGVAAVVRNVLTVYPTQFVIYAWTFAVPVSLAGAWLAGREGDRRGGIAVGTVTFALSVGGGAVAPTVGVPPSSALLVLLTTGMPTLVFAHRVLREGDGRVGLALPVVLVAGTLAGAALVRTFELVGPNTWLDPAYVTSAPSRNAVDAGLYPAIVGSVLVIAFVAVLSFVLGVGSAVFLEEYAPNHGILGALTRLLQINIANLAAVPSVVYGLLGLGLFANLIGLGYGTVVTAGVTLSLLILPITIISAQEAIRAVPDDLRQGSYAMGATRWQTTKRVVLPEALPGILTGTILALGRAIGETAPLIMVGAATTVFSPPDSIWDKISAMPMQIYAWANYPQPEFRYGVVAAGVVTLLIVLLSMNATAIVLRNRYQ